MPRAGDTPKLLYDLAELLDCLDGRLTLLLSPPSLNAKRTKPRPVRFRTS